MRKTWRKLLSLLLALSMAASLTVTGWAQDGNDSGAAIAGEGVKLTELDPATLNVQRHTGRPDIPADDVTDDAPAYAPDDVVRVSIFLDKPSTLEKGYSPDSVAGNVGARIYRRSLDYSQTQMTGEIEKLLGAELDVVWNLTLVANAISANIRYGDLEKIEALDGVKSVKVENRYAMAADAPNTSFTTEKMTGATTVWAEGYTGAGSRVAVIDTGIATGHLSFDGGALEYSLQRNAEREGVSYEAYVEGLHLLTAKEVARVAGQLHAGYGAVDSDSAYISAKIPFAYNYVDGDYDVTHANDRQGEHGSHVEGIAAANRYIPDGNGGYLEAVDAVKAVGVAPDAQIITMKVFGKNGGSYDSDYMAAIEDAIILGCDAANLSLGSSASGFTFDEEYQAVLDSLAESGMVVTIAAGNSGAWTDNLEYGLPYLYSEDVSMHTGGSPGSFINSLCVASADNVGKSSPTITFNENQKVYYTETVNNGGYMVELSGAESYDYVYVDGIGKTEEYQAAADALGGLSGKVILCNRGELSFSEKGNNAIPFKPAAVIVCNNEDGSISMALDGYEGTVPMVSITLEDAEALKAASQSSTVTVTGEDSDETELTCYTGTLTVDSEVSTEEAEDAPYMSDFSSWGVPGSLLMKPEITAPGGNIWSVNGMTDAYYENMSGTSMAAPQVAGMAAVMGQYIRQNGLAEQTGMSVRQLTNSLLMSTAAPLYDRDGNYYPILQQGAGLANVSDAVNAQGYILMGDDATISAADGKVKAELGEDPARSGSYDYTFTLYNRSKMDLPYQMNTEMFTQDVFRDEDDMGAHDYMAYTTVPVAASVSYTVDGAAAHDVDLDGDTDSGDAQAILDKLTGAYPADAAFDADAADLDGDGKYTSYDAYLLLRFLEEQADVIVPAGGSATVTVHIRLTDTAALEAGRPNGAYIEGFTYATCDTATAEGELIREEHSIPILGFYGSWTDPSMFDNTSYLAYACGLDSKEPYTGYTTNVIGVIYPDETDEYILGPNPYVERSEDDPAAPERMAINDETVLNSFACNLIRNAGTMGVTITDDSGKTLWVGGLKSYAYGPYYDDNNGMWMGDSPISTPIGLSAGDLGLAEGSAFTVSQYAIPEYYAMAASGNATGTLDEEAFEAMTADGTLGDGAAIRHTVTVDNTAPTILSATVNEDNTEAEIIIRDNHYVAAVIVLDRDGREILDIQVPAQSAPGEEITLTIPLNDDIRDGFTLLAADYAANEYAVAVGFTPDHATGIEIDNVEDGALSMLKSDTYRLAATVYPITLDDTSVNWSSEDESIVTVDANGLVTALNEGVTTVTATSRKTPDVTATVEITVIEVNKTLNATIWDENGDIWFSEFNNKTLPTFDRLQGESLNEEICSATYDKNGTLYAASFDGKETSNLYTVDESTYTPTLIAEQLEMPVVDMADGPHLGDVLVGVYGPYVLLINKADGAIVNGFDESVDEEGNPMVAGYLVGIAYSGSVDLFGVVTLDLYYLLDDQGNIYEAAFCDYDGTIVNFGAEKLHGSDYGTDTPYWQSLYYDGEFLFWSNFVYEDNRVNLIMSNGEKTYYLGSFDDGVWPVGGLYEKSFLPSVELDETASRVDWEKKAPGRPGLSVDQLSPVQITPVVKPHRNADRPANGAANAVTGRLNAFTGASSAKPAAAPAAADTKEVVITNEVDATNGLYEVKYDPAKLTYDSAKSDVVNFSAHNDAEKGIVTVSFADLTPVTAGSPVATLRFKTPCEDSEITVVTRERNKELALNESGDPIAIKGIGHDWGEPVWEWSADKKSATATFVCANCGEKRVVTATVTSAADKNDKMVYTATAIGPDGRTWSNSVEGPVKTGDMFRMSTYLTMASVSCAAVAALLLLRRRKRAE